MSTASCPACASTHVFWQLHRLQGRGTTPSHRSLAWGCRSCGHQWTVPIGMPGTSTPSPPPPTSPA